VGEDRSILRPGATRLLHRGFRIRQAASLEVTPGKCVLGEDVLTVGGRALRKLDGLADAAIVVGEEARQRGRLRSVEPPSGFGERVLLRCLSRTAERHIEITQPFGHVG
jgi:hypothetical protein